MIRRVTRLFINLFRRSRIERDLNEEVSSYIEMLVERRISEGASPAEARREAMIEFGGADQVKERVRYIRMGYQLEIIAKDLRYAARVLLKHPGLSAAMILTIALAIGANSTIFSFVNATLFRSLPVRNPGSLTLLSPTRQGRVSGGLSYPDYLYYKEHSRSFSDIIAYRRSPFSLSGTGEPERVTGAYVSPNYFSMLGLKPALGRLFQSGDDRSPVAVLSTELWRSHFSSDPAIVGKSINLDGHPITVVGVASADFNGPDQVFPEELWTPVRVMSELTGRDNTANREFSIFDAVARLRNGVSLQQAQSEIDVQAAALELDYPQTNRGLGIALFPAAKGDDPSLRSTLAPVGFLSMLAVGLVLIIACANIANLLLAKSRARRTEIAVRLAIGAGRARLLRQLLTESLLLSLIGGVAGLIVAMWAVEILRGYVPHLPIPIQVGASVDFSLVAFTAGLSLVVGIAFGVTPALSATRLDVASTLKAAGSTTTSPRSRFGPRNMLALVQIAVSFVLMISGGLFLKSVRQALLVHPGFQPTGVLDATIDPGLNGYTPVQSRAFYNRLTERSAAIPGVESVSIAQYVPLSYLYMPAALSNSLLIEGRPPAPDNSPIMVGMNIVGPTYFETMGIPLVEGRAFTTHDDSAAPRVAVINQTMARTYWAGLSAVGKRFSFSPQPDVPIEIIGVVEDGKYFTLGEAPSPYLYLPYLQRGSPLPMTLHLRCSEDPAALIPALREAARSVAPDVPLFNVQPLERVVDLALLPPRLAASLLTIFALLAVGLAAIGVYGVTSYSVVTRTREVGLRLALGATPGDVLRLILKESSALLVLGIAVGAGAFFLLHRIIAGYLYGGVAADPLFLIGVACLFAATILTASWLPARKAAQVDPAVALRYE